MRLQTACFTGHREIPYAEQKNIQKQTLDAVEDLYAHGFRIFCAGGALGFDTLAAQVVLSLKKVHPDIRLHLVLPCKDQTARWSSVDRLMYEVIKRDADEVVYISDEYTRSCMHERNRRLVDESCACICYLKKTTGGTAYTVDYAEKSGLHIVRIG